MKKYNYNRIVAPFPWREKGVYDLKNPEPHPNEIYGCREKADGQNITIIKSASGRIRVLGRTDVTTFAKWQQKLFPEFQEQLKKAPAEKPMTFEMVGPLIGGNRHQLKEHKIWLIDYNALSGPGQKLTAVKFFANKFKIPYCYEMETQHLEFHHALLICGEGFDSAVGKGQAEGMILKRDDHEGMKVYKLKTKLIQKALNGKTVMQKLGPVPANPVTLKLVRGD